VRAQWARTTVRTAAVVGSLAVVGLTVLAAMVATYTAVLLEMASVSVGLAVIGSVLMQPLVGELHAAEFAADDYAADHTGTPGTVESLTQMRSRFEWVTALVPFVNSHPPTTARIEHQHCRAAASSSPG
jgi:Zn-dependent protease with chaperone function